MRASLVAQMVKSLPAMQETQVQSLGCKDPLEKGMATHSSILARKIPWTEEPGELYNPWGCKESDTTEGLSHSCVWKMLRTRTLSEFFFKHLSYTYMFILLL